MSDAALFAGREIATGAFSNRRSALYQTLPIGSPLDRVSPTDEPIASANDETLDYRVQIIPVPRVVANAEVLEICFPGEVIETPPGLYNVIVGTAVAEVTFGDVTIRGVRLC